MATRAPTKQREEKPTLTSREQISQTHEARPILAAIDFTDLSGLALERAFAIASGLEAPLHVVTVAQANGEYVNMDTPERSHVPMPREQAMTVFTNYVQNRLDDYQSRFGPARFGVVICHIRLGDPAREVAQLGSDLEAEMIVVGTHGRSGVKRLVLGSVAEKVVRLAPCPVFVVRSHEVSDETRVPEIEPPCPRCVEARRASGGEEMWCSQHRETLGRRHTYSYVPRNVRARENASLLIPRDPMATHR